VKVDVVALQIAALPGEPDRNRALLAAAIHSLERKADLIVGPELLNSGYDLERIDGRGRELGESLDGPTVELATALAAEAGATIVLGILERDGETLYDSAVVVRPDGVLGRYRKTHLHPEERTRFAAGDHLTTIPTAAGRLGPMICFDHAFPEIATALALADAQILVIPSAVRFGHEDLLSLRTRARAQDNQVFVVAANLVGGDFCGRSLIVGPRGEVLARAGTGEGAVRASLDLGAIERERQREPALGLRRPELYGPEA
jgi:predicted amidohydrolase